MSKSKTVGRNCPCASGIQEWPAKPIFGGNCCGCFRLNIYCVVPACPHAHLTPVDHGDSESSVPVVQISNPSLQAQAVTRGVRLCHKFASYCWAVPKQPLDMQGSCQKT